jgi:hypothetical protein
LTPKGLAAKRFAGREGVMSQAGKLAKAARKYGGQIVFQLGQGEAPLRGMLGLNDRSSNGICRGMVNKWIVELANGRDYWSWLAPNGKVNSAAVGNIMVQHIDVGKVNVQKTSGKNVLWPERSGSGALDGDYLKFYGVVPATQNFTSGSARAWANPVAGKVPEEVGTMLKNNVPSGSAYVFFGMSGGGSGHALGAWTAGENVKFYDPNIGQIDFPAADNVARWLAEAVGTTVYKKYDAVSCQWYESV